MNNKSINKNHKKRRFFGQHFLTSNSIAESIVNFAKITKDDTVLEVGTGKGILTSRLCDKAGKVISIEKDSQLFSEAKEKFSDLSNLVIENGDAFKVKNDNNHEFTVFVSNLPYSESRRAIEWLARKKFKRAIIMVQREFAQKLQVKGGRERRAISILAAYCFEIQNLMCVKRTNFRPPPKVDSVVIQIIPKEQLSHDIVNTVNKLFSFKRKTLSHIGKRMGIEITLEDKRRLEEIPEGEVIEIAKRVFGL
jgi:16S rRNA (adenine1518-N6/adenine1519-N6)-dimethyltransferase